MQHCGLFACFSWFCLPLVSLVIYCRSPMSASKPSTVSTGYPHRGTRLETEENKTRLCWHVRGATIQRTYLVFVVRFANSPFGYDFSGHRALYRFAQSGCRGSESEYLGKSSLPTKMRVLEPITGLISHSIYRHVCLIRHSIRHGIPFPVGLAWCRWFYHL